MLQPMDQAFEMKKYKYRIRYFLEKRSKKKSPKIKIRIDSKYTVSSLIDKPNLKIEDYTKDQLFEIKIVDSAVDALTNNKTEKVALKGIARLANIYRYSLPQVIILGGLEYFFIHLNKMKFGGKREDLEDAFNELDKMFNGGIMKTFRAKRRGFKDSIVNNPKRFYKMLKAAVEDIQPNRNDLMHEMKDCFLDIDEALELVEMVKSQSEFHLFELSIWNWFRGDLYRKFFPVFKDQRAYSRFNTTILNCSSFIFDEKERPLSLYLYYNLNQDLVQYLMGRSGVWLKNNSEQFKSWTESQELIK